MKNIYAIVLTGLVLVSCKEFDADINKDPNNPSTASADQLLSNAQIGLQDVSHSLSGQFYAQYLSETEYIAASQYPVESTSFYGWYQGPLMNLQTILENEMGTTNQQAVAKILKAYYFWFLTDRWGDIPFTEALQGAKNLTPVYDTQESIYASLLDLLEEAEGSIDEALPIPNDIIFGGDMVQWKKLANSIRMLMALRMSEVDETTAEMVFESAAAAGVMTSNDDSFIFQHLSDENNWSYWYGQIGVQGREWWALSATLTANMTNDPRIAVFGAPDSGGDGSTYTGLVFGTDDGIDASAVSLLGTNIWEPEAPVYLITYAELLFAQAEAAQRGWITGGDAQAQMYYEEGIEASFLQWIGNTDSLAAFLVEPTVVYAPGTALEQIAIQKYIHLFMNGYEAWAEYRRTGFPNNMVAPLGRSVPLRQIYVETEQFNNTENYMDAVQRQFGGNDGLYEALWWDQ